MIHVREETPADYVAIDQVNSDAFARQAESDLVRTLRADGALVLSLVAVRDGQIVGHIAFSRARLVRDGEWEEAVALGPMAVLPTYQRRGIGSQLVRAGLESLRAAGAGPVFVLGHPAYYPRFGFEPANRYGISCQFDVRVEVFMVQMPDEARADVDTTDGVFMYHPAFEGV